MKNSFILLASILVIGQSCSNAVNKNTVAKTPHETYADKVKYSTEGQQWINVSKTTLTTPHAIELPYRLMGHFYAGKEQALALQFAAKQGERVNIDLTKKSMSGLVIYADLFRQDGTRVPYLLPADTVNSKFGFDVPETGEYILRLQPELYRTGEYRVALTKTSSIAGL